MAWTEILPGEDGDCGEEAAMICGKLDCIIRHLECISKKMQHQESESEKIVEYHERSKDE